MVSRAKANTGRTCGNYSPAGAFYLRYIEDSEGTNFKAHTWFNYEGPTFMATVTYKFNNYNRRNSANNLDMNYDSGLDH